MRTMHSYDTRESMVSWGCGECSGDEDRARKTV